MSQQQQHLPSKETKLSETQEHEISMDEDSASPSQSQEVVTTKKERKKPSGKRTRLWKEPEADWIIVIFKNVEKDLVNNISSQLAEKDVQEEYPGASLTIYENKRTRFYPPKEVIRARINEKRREYTKSESYQKRHNSEEAKRKIKEYNQKPEVKENKSTRQAAKNLLTKSLKLKDPEEYNRKIEQLMEEIKVMRENKKKQKLENGKSRDTTEQKETPTSQNPKENSTDTSKQSYSDPINSSTRKRKRNPTQPTANTPIAAGS